MSQVTVCASWVRFRAVSDAAASASDARRISSWSGIRRYATCAISGENVADTPRSSATCARVASFLRMVVRRDVSSPVS